MTIPAPGLRPPPVGSQPVPARTGAPDGSGTTSGSGEAPPPAFSPSSGADLRRLTVLGPAGRVDLAVPTSATPGTVLPLLVRHLGGTDDRSRADAGWVLHRPGEPPLDDDTRIDELELLDGNVLHLRPADDPVPELRYDDVADGIVSVVGTSTGRWTPEATGRLLRGLGGFALVVGAALLVVGLPAPAVALAAAAVAVVLAGGAVLLARWAGQPDAALVAGLGGVGFAVLTGVYASGAPGATPSAPGLLLAAAVAGVCAALLFVGRLAPVVTGVVVGLALATALTVGVAGWLGVGWGGAIATVAVAVVVASSIAARVAVRSDRLLSVLSICSAVLVALAAAALLAGPDWIHWVLPAVLGLAALLRARAMGGVVQRAVLTWGGAVALGVVLVGRAADGALGLVLGLLVVALVAAGAVLVVSWRMPGGRLLPIWGRVADITELWTALVLVPLLLQLHDVYAIFRGLNA